MTRDIGNDSGREGQLNEVLLAYVEALQAGMVPDRCQLLAAHPGLRGELEEFFAGHDEVERLAAPLRGATRDNAPRVTRVSGPDPNDSTAEIGELGDFRLLREVGRGGMGVVYEAEQISLRRRVALKVLPFAAAIDPRQLQRFKNEALAAAHLRHENIVPVHAVGAERGVHYYAMQFIEGQSLAHLIADLRLQIAGLSGQSAICNLKSAMTETPPIAALATERSSGSRRYYDWVASLGRQAALALEHAHSVGIVHRDVKPANLLLDPRGQLWVTDFGLAQVSGDVGLTVTGEVLGTLRYASPEQVLARRGVVDHRSDVYSLGATLYEMLTLSQLFEGRDRNELLRKIGGEEPRPPRSVDPSLPAELETIVLKALGKEPSERYATAQELADDLGRFLDNRPILARRPTTAERLRKWSRRHPSIVGAAVVVLILLCAGSLLSTALIRSEQERTKAEQRKAEEAYRRERQRAEEAEARFRLARSSVDETIRISDEELADRPGLEVFRKRLLRSALAYYQEFIEQRRDDPQAQAELLETKQRVEKILADLAVLRAASQLYLLYQTPVLDDLHLSNQQQTKVQDFANRVGRHWRESFHDVGRVSSAERGRRAVERAHGYEVEINAILTPGQQLRLRQIGLQSEGPGAFREPEVVSELQLTAHQRERIRTIEDESFCCWMKTAWSAMPPAEAAKANRARIELANHRILALLTPEQSQRWNEMSGEPLRGLTYPFSAPPAPSDTRHGPKRQER